MKRGELYRVRRATTRDPKNYRVYVIVSRQALVHTTFPTVICAPVYSSVKGLSSEVEVGPDEGLKHISSIHCDELISIEKSKLTNFIGSLNSRKLQQLNEALRIALALS